MARSNVFDGENAEQRVDVMLFFSSSIQQINVAAILISSSQSESLLNSSVVQLPLQNLLKQPERRGTKYPRR